MTARTLRIALLFWCLATSTAQGWVAQLHVHGAASAAVATAVVVQASAADVDPTSGLPLHAGECLLCQVVFHGVGLLLAAVPPVPAVASLRFLLRSPVDETAGRSVFRSHHWLSRGPPRR
jgi:hypothetical protein